MPARTAVVEGLRFFGNLVHEVLGFRRPYSFQKCSQSMVVDPRIINPDSVDGRF